jgi:hypothetical protein
VQTRCQQGLVELVGDRIPIAHSLRGLHGLGTMGAQFRRERRDEGAASDEVLTQVAACEQSFKVGATLRLKHRPFLFQPNAKVDPPERSRVGKPGYIVGGREPCSMGSTRRGRPRMRATRRALLGLGTMAAPETKTSGLDRRQSSRWRKHTSCFHQPKTNRSPGAFARGYAAVGGRAS